MSDGSSGNLLTTSVFNPALLRKEDLVRGFVARQALLERLLDDLGRVQPGSPPQHQLVIGQRGLGKTTLLRRMAFAIEDDRELSAKWIPLVFPEEQYNVKNLGDFWLNCADALSDALEATGNAVAAALDKRVEEMPPDPNRRSEEAVRVLLEEANRLGRGLVLLVDNLDVVLDRLSGTEEWEFRRVISSVHGVYLIGASSRALEATYEHGRAFYDYFQVHDLKGFSDDDTFALLNRLAEEARDERVQKLLRENPARVRALRVLTGGNPRTLVLLYRVLAEGPESDVQRDIEQLLDLYTPLYKARFEEMAQQAQQVVDAMALHWDPVTAAELAQKLAPLSVNQVSAQLSRLEDFGVVEKTPWFGEKKTAFQLAERFFNIWYLMRASRRVRRRLAWLVKFLEAWFEREELAEQARGYLSRDPESVGLKRYAEMALAYSQTLKDRHLRRSLESAGLLAALDVSVRDLIDFSDLPPELQDRRQRMQQLRELQSRVLEMHLDGVDPRELWRVLGGSPHLSLEEKARVVNELPALGVAGVRELYGKLKRAEHRLLQLCGPSAPDAARLYESLADGEITDIYDLDGAVSVANRWNCRRLPWVAIASRCNLFCSPEALSQDELRRAESALHALAEEPGYEATGWSGLGNLLKERLKRYGEAEQAYRHAIEIDPHAAFAWNNLGNLLMDHLERYDEAEQAYRRAIEIDPQDAFAWHNLGNLLTDHLERYDEAERAYRRAIEIDPQLAFGWHNLGNLLTDHLERYDEAERAYRRAIEIDPQLAFCWHNLGNLLTDHLERYDEAEQAYRRAIKIDPQDAFAWHNLGNLLTDHLERYDEAEQAYRRAIEIDPQDGIAWYRLAHLLERDSRRQAEALDAYCRSVELEPEREWVQYFLTLHFLPFARSLGRGPQRVAVLRSVTRVHKVLPNNLDIQFVLAGLLVLDGRWDEAKSLLERLGATEIEKPDVWTFNAVVEAGHLTEALLLLERTGADQRWRPLYEALRAVQAGTADYLRRVAPEVRTVAAQILAEIAPELAKQTRKRRK